MPSKKKNRNSKTRTDDSYHVLARYAVATLASGTVVAIIFGINAYTSPDAQLTGQNVLRYMPPVIGAVATFTARPVKKLLGATFSDTLHAALLGILLSLLATGLLMLIG